MKQNNNKNELIRLTKDLIQFKTTQDHPDETKKCMQYIKDYFIEDDLNIKEFNNSGKRSLYICFTDKKNQNCCLTGILMLCRVMKSNILLILKTIISMAEELRI